MGLPPTPVTLTTEQIAELNQKLSEMRHNVNNHLALIVAAAELMRRKPEMAARFLTSFTEQPQRISDEIRRFSVEFESFVGISREQ